MTNKSGSIGTWTETSVVLHLRGNGFAGADEMTKSQRLRLNGADDQGDVGVCPGVMFEVKGGHAAEKASDAQITAWLEETEAERQHRGADVAALIRKRKGKGRPSAGQWWAHIPGWTYYYLAVNTMCNPAPANHYAEKFAYLPPACMALDELLILIRRAGYGDPITPPRKDAA